MGSEAQSAPTADLVSMNLDKLTPNSLKSKEEIKRHSIDIVLEEKPIDKAIYFLKKGDNIQRLSVIQSLVDLFRQDPSGCSQKLIPTMHQDLQSASSEFHLATSVTVKSLMERKIIPLDTFIQSFLHTVLIGTDHQDPVVADAWVDCLLHIIPNLPLSVLQKDILHVAVSKGAHQKSVPSRISSCYIIGAICKKYTSVDAKRDLVPLVLSLCQDVHHDVRAAIALQIPSVVRLLGSETSKNLLLPAMVDLASDEIPRVKEAAFTSLVESIPFFSSDVIKTVILPLLIQLINYAFKYDHNILLAVASGFGKMVTGLERVMQQSDKDTYLQYYMKIVDKSSNKFVRYSQLKLPSKIGSPQGQGGTSMKMTGDTAILCRQYCAYNLPAMAKFLFNDASKSSLETLHKIFKDLLSDPSPTVRRSVTVSFHELVTIYGKYKAMLKPDICKSLLDQEEGVLSGFIHQLGFILLNFVRLSYNQNEQNFQDSDMLSALLACENLLGKSSNWRLHSLFVEQMEVLWYIFPTDIVYNNFIYKYFEKIYLHRALPIRLAYIRTIMTNIKHTPKELFRIDSLNKLHELATSHNFYNRMLYIRACDIALEIYSTSFFKEHFLFRLLQMAGDPVANIRWGLCRLLPKMYCILKLPADKELLTELDRLKSDLSKDSDSEVIFMLGKANREEFENNYESLFPDDQAKYDEEKKVFSLNSKLVQNYPASCAKMFEPTIHGTPIMRRSSFAEAPSNIESIGTQVDSSSSITPMDTPGPSKQEKRAGSKGHTGADSHSGFTDKEFLVDAGVKLPVCSNSLPSNNTNMDKKEILKETPNISSRQNLLLNSNNILNKCNNNEEIAVNSVYNGVSTKNKNLMNEFERNQALVDYIVEETIPPKINNINSESEMINELVDKIAVNKSLQNNNNVSRENERNLALIDLIVKESLPKINIFNCESEKVNKLVDVIVENKTPVENNNFLSVFEPNDVLEGMKTLGNVNSDTDCDKIEQNESNTSPKKKQIFRHSIPVRKKSNPPQQVSNKDSEALNNSSGLVKAEKRRSLQVQSSSKLENSEPLHVEKRQSIGNKAQDKRLSLEVVDFNRNVTDSDVIASNSTVQRRKRSQLPRPLSCVVLPLRNRSLDKTNANSKLPIIRRN